MSLLRWLRICSWLNRLYESRFVLRTWQFLLSNRSGYSCTISLLCCFLGANTKLSLIITILNYACVLGLVSWHTVLSWSHHGFFGLTCWLCLNIIWYTPNSAYRSWRFFRCRLLLTFIPVVKMTTRLFLCWDSYLLSSFNCFFDTLRMFGWTLLRVWSWAANLVIETKDMSHALFQLGLAQSVTTHSHKLIWP